MMDVFLYDESTDGDAVASLEKEYDRLSVYLGMTRMVKGRTDEYVKEAIIKMPHLGVALRGVDTPGCPFRSMIEKLTEMDDPEEIESKAMEYLLNAVACDAGLFRAIVNNSYVTGYLSGYRKKGEEVAEAFEGMHRLDCPPPLPEGPGHE